MFFIMICGYGDKPIPVTDEDDSVATFETEKLAQKCADEQPLCQATGYEIFEM